jgi:hypothetical protein
MSKTIEQMETVCRMGERGGKREGAGRKPREDGTGRSIPKSIKVSQEVANYLEEFGTGLIEDSVRRTKAFREWQKTLQVLKGVL